MKNEILEYIKSEVAKGNHPAQAAVARHFGLLRQNVNPILQDMRARGLIDWTVSFQGCNKIIFYTFPENNT